MNIIKITCIILLMFSPSFAKAAPNTLNEEAFKAGWKGDFYWRGQGKSFKGILRPSTDYRNLGGEKLALNLKLSGAPVCIGELTELGRSEDGLFLLLKSAPSNECKNDIEYISLLALGKRLIRAEFHGSQQGIAVAMLEPAKKSFNLTLPDKENPQISYNGRALSINQWTDFVMPSFGKIQGGNVYSPFKRGVFYPDWRSSTKFTGGYPAKVKLTSTAYPYAKSDATHIEIRMLHGSCSLHRVEAGSSVDGRTLYLVPKEESTCEDTPKLIVTAIGGNNIRAVKFNNSGVIASGVLSPTTHVYVKPLDLITPEVRQAAALKKQQEEAAKQAAERARLQAEKEKWASSQWPPSLEGLYLAADAGMLHQAVGAGRSFQLISARMSQYGKDSGRSIGTHYFNGSYDNNTGIVSLDAKVYVMPKNRRQLSHCKAMYLHANKYQISRLEGYELMWKLTPLKQKTCERFDISVKNCNVSKCSKYMDDQGYIASANRAGMMSVAEAMEAKNGGKNSFKKDEAEINRTNTMRNGNFLEILNEVSKEYNKQYGR